jgi:signal peptidase II
MVKYLSLFVIISFITVILDQITKYIISTTRPIINTSLINIQYYTNTGAGFGLFQGRVGILTFISVLVAATVIFFYKKIPQEKWPQVFFAFFLGGVVGNLIDRVLYGFVIDFINFRIWPAFNIADATVTIGVIGIIITMWKK